MEAYHNNGKVGCKTSNLLVYVVYQCYKYSDLFYPSRVCAKMRVPEERKNPSPG